MKSRNSGSKGHMDHPSRPWSLAISAAPAPDGVAADCGGGPLAEDDRYRTLAGGGPGLIGGVSLPTAGTPLPSAEGTATVRPAFGVLAPWLSRRVVVAVG